MLEFLGRKIRQNTLYYGYISQQSGQDFWFLPRFPLTQCNRYLSFFHIHILRRFDIVDLDPYGAPVQFLDGAVQSVTDGGLLCVTCTDMAVLCGNASETCYTKYGAISIRGKNCHEHALRIVLQCIESHANRYGRYIVRFYIRYFHTVYTVQYQ